MKSIKILLLAALLGSAAFAHQIVAVKKDKTYEAAYWSHGSYGEYDKWQLKGVKALDNAGKTVNAGIDFAGKNPKILTDGEVGVMALSFDAGYWTKTSDGYKNISPKEAKDTVFTSLKSVKYGKTYFTWDSSYLKPMGLKLEVVPLIDPFSVKAGGTLPVLVLKDGKPLPFAGFETSDYEDPEFKTDAFGIAHVHVKNKGVQIIAAKYYAQQSEDSTVDNITIQSCIAFEVK